MTDKVDLKKELDCYRARRGEFRVVDVPPLRYLAVDGAGDPNTGSEFADATAALYPVAYALKFASRAELGRDYVVMPLEGLWWADDMEAFTARRDKSRWSWRLINLVPDWVPDELLGPAVEKAASRGAPEALARLRLERLDEGLSVQTLHVGPYDDEGEVLHRLHHEVVPQGGFALTGRHHEIYLGDARRVPPEKLRTILRQPVVRAG